MSKDEKKQIIDERREQKAALRQRALEMVDALAQRNNLASISRVVSHVAHELGVSSSSIYYWMAQAQKNNQ